MKHAAFFFSSYPRLLFSVCEPCCVCVRQRLLSWAFVSIISVASAEQWSVVETPATLRLSPRPPSWGALKLPRPWNATAISLVMGFIHFSQHILKEQDAKFSSLDFSKNKRCSVQNLQHHNILSRKWCHLGVLFSGSLFSGRAVIVLIRVNLLFLSAFSTVAPLLIPTPCQ